MARNHPEFQPGAILHDAIMGVMKARRLSLEDWCAANGCTPSAIRNATYGQGRGPKGRALLDKLLETVGRDLVRPAYEHRLREHMAALQKGAA